MKKIKSLIFIMLAIFLISSTAFANGSKEGDSEAEETSSLSQSWKDFGNTMSEAGKSFGNAMGETGKKAGDKFSEIVNTNYYGKWVFETGNTVTTISLNEDKTMEIFQKSPLLTEYWKGTYNGAIAFLTFKINETGKIVHGKTSTIKDEKTWRINYSMTNDDTVLVIRCDKIPTTEDGHKFSNDTPFILQK